MSGPARAEARVQRLLVMLPWLMERGEVALDDVATRFGVTPAQVTKDLELVAMCGLPPYVDEMIDVFIDDGIVFVGVPRLFTRPLRLTTPEAFAVLAAGRLALELPGSDADGPLGRALVKLNAAVRDAIADGEVDDNQQAEPAPSIGSAIDDTAGVVIDIERPQWLDDLAEAAATGAQQAISYYSPASDEVTSRRIVPRHVYVSAGVWYVLADDDRSGERRVFRVDRIDALQPTGEFVDVENVEPPEGFLTGAELPIAELLVAPGAMWVFDPLPVVARVDGADPRRPDWTLVSLPVRSDRWLTDLLLRLGPDAEVIEPASAADALRTTARTMLELYSTDW